MRTLKRLDNEFGQLQYIVVHAHTFIREEEGEKTRSKEAVAHSLSKISLQLPWFLYSSIANSLKISASVVPISLMKVSSCIGPRTRVEEKGMCRPRGLFTKAVLILSVSRKWGSLRSGAISLGLYLMMGATPSSGEDLSRWMWEGDKQSALWIALFLSLFTYSLYVCFVRCLLHWLFLAFTR